jgi:hypothetical protein
MFIGLAIVAASCPGQVLDSQDDSLLIDEFHTPANNGASRPDDTMTRHNKMNAIGATDTMHQHQKTDIPVASDTIPQQQGTGKPITTDTLPHRQDLGKPETAEPPRTSYTEEAPVEPVIHNLSPFTSDRVHYLGLSLDYFSYAEVSTLDDIFGDNQPLLIIGAPKSTEHGLMFGFNYQGSIRQHGSPILFRPDLEVQIGIHQTYDGSTQALPIFDQHGDTIPGEFQFLPVKIYKSNYFAQAGVDIGYCLTHTFPQYYFYSGIKGKLWYRDLIADTTSYANQITNSEVYYWFSIPIGLTLSMPVSPNFAWGIDASCDLMFKGYMQVLNSLVNPDSTYKTVSPTVNLGNRVGFHVEFPITYKSANENIFRFTPYFTIYSFGHSETEISQSFVNGVYTQGSDQAFSEPSSASWLLGVKFQLVFMSPYTLTR